VIGSDTGARISGGIQYVDGSATGAIVSSRGTQAVEADAVAVGATVNNGGTQYDYGTTSGTQISSGGVQFVVASVSPSSGGIASATAVNGGQQIIESGGSAIGTSVNFGGVELVLSGGVARSATANIGGYVSVEGGGVISGAIISGGTLAIAQNGIIGGSISFGAGAGQLILGGTYLPTPLISGFAPGDAIDLPGLTYGNGGSVTLQSGNVLRVQENGVVYTLDLDPAQNFSGEVFTLSPYLPNAAISQVLSGGALPGTQIGLTVPPAVVSGGQTLSVSSGQTLSPRSSSRAGPRTFNRGALPAGPQSTAPAR
jgi:autotransporter passenger strand-loop-strand repeat protein